MAKLTTDNFIKRAEEFSAFEKWSRARQWAKLLRNQSYLERVLNTSFLEDMASDFTPQVRDKIFVKVFLKKIDENIVEVITSLFFGGKIAAEDKRTFKFDGKLTTGNIKKQLGRNVFPMLIKKFKVKYPQFVTGTKQLSHEQLGIKSRGEKMSKQIIEKLVEAANELDKKGFRKEADEIDRVLTKTSASFAAQTINSYFQILSNLMEEVESATKDKNQRLVAARIKPMEQIRDQIFSDINKYIQSMYTFMKPTK